MKVAVVEDEAKYVEELKQNLERFQKEYMIPIEVSCFQSGDLFLRKYKSQYDLILLDIQMAFIDGMQVAQDIRKIDTGVVIIFVTSAAQYALQGYKVGAFDYILKPVEYFVLSQSLLKACQSLNNRQKRYLNLKIKSGRLRMDVDEICYIESKRHTMEVHALSGIYEVYGTLRELEEELRDCHFVRGNIGYLISLKHVTAIRENAVIINGDTLALSRNRRENFLNELMEYWGNV